MENCSLKINTKKMHGGVFTIFGRQFFVCFGRSQKSEIEPSMVEDQPPVPPKINGLSVHDVYELSRGALPHIGILLSRDMDYEHRDRTGEELFYWKVAISHHGMGCQVVDFTDREIHRGKYLGNVLLFLKPVSI